MDSSINETKVLRHIKGEDVARLALDIAAVRSPDGYELDVGDFLFNWLKQNGFQAYKQYVVKDRYNIVGTIKGSGSGFSLIFNSHMDTGLALEDEDYWRLRAPDLAQYQSWIEDEKIFGQDVINDKGPMACFLIAAKAIKESGVSILGDLLLTMVIGEMSFTAVDEYCGPKYAGVGAGAKHLVTHGVTGDYAVVAEISSYAPSWVECGDARFKITVLGEALYTPRVYHPEELEKNPSAIVRMARIIEALVGWARAFEQNNKFEFSQGGYKGVIVPKVNIGAIRGGLPYRPTYSAGVCSLYVHVFFPPIISLVEVKDQLVGFLKRLDVKADVEMYSSQRGYEGKNISRLLGAIDKAHVRVFGDELPPKQIDSTATSCWRDVNSFNEAGIPAITYGPPAIQHLSQTGLKTRCFTFTDLERMTRLYALIAMDICNRKKL